MTVLEYPVLQNAGNLKSVFSTACCFPTPSLLTHFRGLLTDTCYFVCSKNLCGISDSRGLSPRFLVGGAAIARLSLNLQLILIFIFDLVNSLPIGSSTLSLSRRA